MLFWKIDDETIRCLINRDEIGEMGFDMDSLSDDVVLMDEFLNAIVKHSKDYLNWNTDNGIQNYFTRALPADQFLITISCTFTDFSSPVNFSFGSSLPSLFIHLVTSISFTVSPFAVRGAR